MAVVEATLSIQCRCRVVGDKIVICRLHEEAEALVEKCAYLRKFISTVKVARVADEILIRDIILAYADNVIKRASKPVAESTAQNLLLRFNDINERGQTLRLSVRISVDRSGLWLSRRRTLVNYCRSRTETSSNNSSAVTISSVPSPFTSAIDSDRRPKPAVKYCGF